MAPRQPTIIERTLFPTPFRSAQLMLSERFAAAGSVLQQPGAQAPDFDDQLNDIIALLGGKFETDNGVHLSAKRERAHKSSSGCSVAAGVRVRAPLEPEACRSLRTTTSAPLPPSTPSRDTERPSHRHRFSTSRTWWFPLMSLPQRQIRKPTVSLRRSPTGCTVSAVGTAPSHTRTPGLSKRWRLSRPPWSRTESRPDSWDRPLRSRSVSLGIGSGIGAILGAPLGGAVLAASIIYREDFDYRSLIPGFITSGTAFAVFG